MILLIFFADDNTTLLLCAVPIAVITVVAFAVYCILKIKAYRKNESHRLEEYNEYLQGVLRQIEEKTKEQIQF